MIRSKSHGDQVTDEHESEATMKKGERIDRRDTIMLTMGARPDYVASRSRRLP